MVGDLGWLRLAEDYVLELPVAPEALSSRLRASINVRPRRALGVIKVHSEWVGVVSGNDFSVWERSGHATRASGRILRRRGGSRVEARIALTRWTWVLLAVIFGLFAVLAGGQLGSEGALDRTAGGIAVAVIGGLVTLAFFWWTALRQRGELRRFLDSVLRSSGA